MRQVQPFELERYFARHEFTARYLLSSSDCESLSQAGLLVMADEEMASAWQELRLGYTETRGHPLLQEEIAALYPNISPAEVLVAAPEEAIFLFMYTLLQPGDHVICTFPGYQSLYELAQAVGCQVSLWQPHEEQGWAFDLDDLRQMVRPDTRLVVVNFPHNPTGYLPTEEEFTELINIVRQRGAYLFSDEMYRFLEIGEAKTLPAACDQYEKAISLSGLSKAFGLPGLRIGWLAGKDAELLDRVARLKDYTTICSSAPSEILAIIALRNRQAVIAEQQERLGRNLRVLDRFFGEYRDIFQYQPPRAGSVCFPRLVAADSSDEFCEQLVAEAGILLVPSRVFQYGDHHLRVGFGRENLPEVIGRFSDYLDQCFHR